MLRLSQKKKDEGRSWGYRHRPLEIFWPILVIKWQCPCTHSRHEILQKFVGFPSCSHLPKEIQNSLFEFSNCLKWDIFCSNGLPINSCLNLLSIYVLYAIKLHKSRQTCRFYRQIRRIVDKIAKFAESCSASCFWALFRWIFHKKVKTFL